MQRSVYVAGSYKNHGNGKVFGGIGVCWKENPTLSFWEPLHGIPTSQRTQIVGAMRSMESAILQGHTDIVVYTSANFLIKVATAFRHTWAANGYRNPMERRVTNFLDYAKLFTLMDYIDVTWVYMSADKRDFHGKQAHCLAQVALCADSCPQPSRKVCGQCGDKKKRLVKPLVLGVRSGTRGN